MEEKASMKRDLLSLPVNTLTRFVFVFVFVFVLVFVFVFVFVNTLTRFVSPRAKSSARRDPRVKVRRVRAPFR